jgi:hypothetical protein
MLQRYPCAPLRQDAKMEILAGTALIVSAILLDGPSGARKPSNSIG